MLSLSVCVCADPSAEECSKSSELNGYMHTRLRRPEGRNSGVWKRGKLRRSVLREASGAKNRYTNPKSERMAAACKKGKKRARRKMKIIRCVFSTSK
jgi:hypothetical protein